MILYKYQVTMHTGCASSDLGKKSTARIVTIWYFCRLIPIAKVNLVMIQGVHTAHQQLRGRQHSN